MKTLEQQALVPMFGDHPIELGLREGDRFLPGLGSDPRYRKLFVEAFPEEHEADRITIANVTKAIASFERSIVSARSPYDRYHYDRDDAAISESAKRGEILFFSQHISCFRCHSGFNFTDSTVSARDPNREVEYHNTGLYNPNPEPNTGIFEFTKTPEDRGKFKAPTLRNIALTAPYMHDGSIPTLEGVIDHYAAGGRNGRDNPNKDPLVGGFRISSEERADLVAFLNTLTDDELVHDRRFSNPWSK
jgi:cytochrome c peroxidase